MTNELEALIRQIVSEIEGAKRNTTHYSTPHTSSTLNRTAVVDRVATIEDYPIAKKHPEWIDLGQGRDLSHITMDNVMAGHITMDDLKISPSILKAQGQIAKAGGRDQIELNFSRAAEMTKVSDKRLLEMYNALRPSRSSKQELLDIASELDGLGAPICANFVREAAENYERRKKLKGDN
ncbi:MAG: diol dehydratase small subunit [Veillonella sp.]|nr:diol dehydratase small subunit [Veillonella sp.]